MFHVWLVITPAPILIHPSLGLGLIRRCSFVVLQSRPQHVAGVNMSKILLLLKRFRVGSFVWIRRVEIFILNFSKYRVFTRTRTPRVCLAIYSPMHVQTMPFYWHVLKPGRWTMDAARWTMNVHRPGFSTWNTIKMKRKVRWIYWYTNIVSNVLHFLISLIILSDLSTIQFR
jgi:hypothetical protein